MEEEENWNNTSLLSFSTPSPILPSANGTLNYAGLFLTIIPLITLLGNLLVIVSVLRFRALHSAINFLILGLAVADLLVAIIVMPYAVYIYVTNGDWYLGNLMCDIYMAFDVGCSTASILLLAVISFDRYRAVSLPIQYSRQSQNIQRVFAMIGGIWFISLALASPMVFGVNVRPSDANPYECRFYNAEFSILSSMISFVIPCILVLFVYIRIIIALKKREKAAKQRREKNNAAHGLAIHNEQDDEQIDEEAAGRIVAGPVVNVMMAALPSMTKRMRRFERHRRAIELAGEDWEEEEEEDEDDVADEYHADDGQGVVEASAPRTTSMLRRIINAASATSTSTSPVLVSASNFVGVGSRRPALTPTNSPRNNQARASTTSTTSTRACLEPSASSQSTSSPFQPLPFFQEKDFGNSSTPRSSMDSLSENVNVVTNDFISENLTTLSRRSSFADESSQQASSQTSSGDGKSFTKGHRRFNKLSRNYSTKHHKKVVKLNRTGSRNTSLTTHDDAIIPAIIRTISRRSPRLFRKDKSSGAKKHSMILANPNTETPKEYRKASMPIRQTNSQTETETISASKDMATTAMSRSTTANSAELLGSMDGGLLPAVVSETAFVNYRPLSETHIHLQPTVSFALTVREMDGNGLNNLKGGSVESSRRVSTAEAPLAVKILTRPSLPKLARMDSVGTTCSSKTRADSLRSCESRESKKSLRNGMAVKMVKKAIKHEHSLKRKVSKAQRKEKRATKTLGVVVGVFLVCWVPFFVINIQNAVCMLLEKEFCQVGYDLFFYCTWIGYMNSFMNPIIYTIFNTEFRRAFKSLIFGRNHARNRHFRHKQANV